MLEERQETEENSGPKMTLIKAGISGRSPKTIPIQPGRKAKRQASSLAFSQKELPVTKPPPGAKNYDNTCYALSVFQLICGHENISNLLRSLEGVLGERLPPGIQAWYAFNKAWKAGDLVDIPNLRSLFLGESDTSNIYLQS